MATRNAIGSNKPLEVSFGGTQQVTLTNHAPLKGNGAGAIGNFGVGTNGQILIGSGVGAPIWANITPGTNIDITNSAHGIDITVDSGFVAGAAVPWVPTFNFSVSSAGITYTTQSGRYLTLGKVIFFSFQIVLSSKGSGNGNAFIGGLPGTIVGTDQLPCSIVIYNSTGIAGIRPVIGAMQVADNTISCLSHNTSLNYPPLTNVNFNNNSEIYGNGFYFIP